MAVQNPFFGKREPETFQPRHTTVTPSSSVNSVAPTSASTSAATSSGSPPKGRVTLRVTITAAATTRVTHSSNSPIIVRRASS